MEQIDVLNPTERKLLIFLYRWNDTLPPNAGDVKQALSLPASTVSSTLRRLKEKTVEEPLIYWEPRHSIQLTEHGQRTALHLDRHHHVLEFFLHHSLGMKVDEAHEEAEMLGLGTSCRLVQLIIDKHNIDEWQNYCVCPHHESCGGK